MKEELLPNKVLALEGCNHPKLWCMYYISCTWLVINDQSSSDAPIDDAPHAVASEDTYVDKPIDPQMPDQNDYIIQPSWSGIKR